MNAQNVIIDGKLPYKIPLMSEINNLPKNGYKVISTFSGGGGSSTGYKMAGYDVIWANEFVLEAQNTYRINHPTTFLNTEDIRTISYEQILQEANIKVGELDILDGSPPCSNFSTVGNVHKSWNKLKKYSDGKVQIIEDLFFEYTRLVNDLQPKVLIAENVSGLIKGKSKGYFLDILKKLKDCGYQVQARLLNSAYLGVPQSRERIIFIGIRNDLNKLPCFPNPFPYTYSINDVLDLNKDLIPDIKLSPCLLKQWDIVKIGEYSERYFQFHKVNPDRPCPTILANYSKGACFVHPYFKRIFNLNEIKILSSFPSDYILTGKIQQQYERIGRSVPPVMMMHIAKTIENNILR